MRRSSRSTSTHATALLQPQFGEDAHQDHDGHHAADDVHNQMSAVSVLVALALSNSCHGLSGVGPDGRVIVGADALVQTLLSELAAEAVEAGTAAVEENTCVTVEGWVPLTHDVIIALAAGPTERRAVLVVWVNPT